MSPKKTAIFPGTFDPFTIGHLSIVKRGLELLDEIIIAIGVNEAKSSYYMIDERLESDPLPFPRQRPHPGHVVQQPDGRFRRLGKRPLHPKGHPHGQRFRVRAHHRRRKPRDDRDRDHHPLHRAAAYAHQLDHCTRTAPLRAKTPANLSPAR